MSVSKTSFWVTVAAAAPLAAANADVKTASWYATHNDARERVVALCRDNPGQAKHNANCDNASQAQVLVALADSRAGSQSSELISPATPRYWLVNAEDLKQRLFICDKLPESQQAANYCPAARAAASRLRR